MEERAPDDNYDGDFDEEDEDEEYGCEYCDDETDETFECPNPYWEEIDEHQNIYFKYICEDCCRERVEERDYECVNNPCERLPRLFKEIRHNEVPNFLKEANFEWEAKEDQFIAKDQSWQLFVSQLPKRVVLGEPIEVGRFKILLSSKETTALFLIDTEDTLCANLAILDKFKNGYDQSVKNYYTYTRLEKSKDGKEIKHKWLIVELDCGGEGYPSDYLVLPMVEPNYSYGNEFIYDPAQVRLVEYYEEALTDIVPSVPLNLFFAGVNLTKKDYNVDGSLIPEAINPIETQISQNLDRALELKANLIFFPEYCYPKSFLKELVKFSRDHKVWIVGGAERLECATQINSESITKRHNITFIISPNKVFIQKKFCQAAEEPNLEAGKKINIFHTKFGTFAISTCADFLDNLILPKLRRLVDLLLVPSFNKDTDTFKRNAETICFTNMCFIAINNTKKYGGAVVYGPHHGDRKFFSIKQDSDCPLFEYDLRSFHLHRTEIKISSEFKSLPKRSYETIQ